MFTTAFRFFAALSVAALVGALVSAVGSDTDQGWIDRVIGPVSGGWKGGIGDHLAYTVLLSLAFVAAGLAGIHVAFRDADPESEAEVVHTETVPLTRAPYGTNFLPIMGVFAVVVLIVGQITNKYVTLGGLLLLGAVIAVWTLRAWAERATGDEEVNHEIYQRFIAPFRIPVLAVVCIALVAIGLSRVLLAVSETGAVVVFGVVGAVFLFGAVLLAARPSVSKNVITIVLFIAAIAVVAAGIAGAVVGERDFEHEQEQEGVNPGGDEGALAPIHVQLPAPVQPPA